MEKKSEVKENSSIIPSVSKPESPGGGVKVIQIDSFFFFFIVPTREVLKANYVIALYKSRIHQTKTGYVI